MGMLRLRRVLFILTLIMMSAVILFACGKKKEIAKPQEPQYINEVAVNYTSKLQVPDVTIKNRDEFIYALDYMRFYMISKPIKFNIAINYKKKIDSIHHEYELVSQLSDIAELSSNNLDHSRFESEGIIVIHIREGKFATKPNKQDTSKEFAKNKDYLDNLRRGGSEYKTFYTDEYVKKLDVENSEQLYYAVQNGYKPVVKSGSIAEQIYEESKTILRRILKQEMDEILRARQIFNYLTTEVQYDYKILEDHYSGSIEPYAYYLEGAILTKTAVCDGKSKAYVLLLAMAGIESKRVTAKDYEGNGHSYNYIKLGDKWYLSCTTYGQVNDRQNLLGFNDSVIYSRYNMFLTTAKTDLGLGINNENLWKYKSLKHENIYKEMQDEPYDTVEKKFKNNLQLISYLESNKEEFTNKYRANEYSEYMTFQIEIEDEKIDIDRVENISTTEVKLKILANRSKSKNLYTIIFYFS